nr:reverse transcriptase domain-containing protein [Tanacetum cinerariifolium]
MPNLKPSIPYPLRHDNERRRDQDNEQIEKFYEMFKDTNFEICFTDALILMPKFASTLKALIGNKEKLSEMARTPMNEHCSTVILNKFPKKLGDPDKFLIPCEFLRMDECLALSDLGASINLMPLSVWEGLLLPKLSSTCMTLELADRSVSKPIGIAKDVSIKVGVFHFPADVVVIDFEPDPRVSLILRMCFLKAGRALIDVHKGELTLRIENEAITYNLDQTARYSANYNQMTVNASPAIVEPLRIELPFLEDQFQEDPPKDPPEGPMADNRTMAELLQTPTKGYEDAIVIPKIAANNFELKHGQINLIQNKQFFGHDKEDPHAHTRYFNKITSTMRVTNVPSSSIKLMFFPFSLEGEARICLEKEPPRSILTWDDHVTKFINQFFPPSKTTNLRNEIMRFQQRFDESFYEAWDRFNDLLRACPHHGFFELHQLNTFYNALNVNDQDSLNSATGAILSEVSELKDIVRALLLDKKNQSLAPTQSLTPAPVKAVEPNYVTCDGTHSYQNCPATSGNIYRDNIKDFPPYQNNQNNFNRGNNFNQNRGGNFNQSNFNQGGNFNQGQLLRPQVNQPPAYQAPAYQAPIPQTQSVSKTDFESYVKAIDTVLRNMQNQGQNLQIKMANLTDMLSKFVSSNTASSSGSGTLLSNTITNPKEDLKGITTQSGVAYQGPTIPTPSKVMKQGTEVTKDQVKTPSLQSTVPVQPPVVQSETQTLVSEPVVAPVSAPMPNLKPSIPYPSRRDNERRRDQAAKQIKKFYEIFKDMKYSQEVLGFSDAPYDDPIISTTSLTLTPFGDSDFLLFEEADAFLGLSLPELTLSCMTLELADRSVSKPIDIAKDVSVKVRVFHFPTDFMVVDFEPDPRVPLILERCFLKTSRALIDVHKGELTLRIKNKAITYNLNQTSRYSANYNQMTANKIDVICEEYSQEVLG